MADRLRVHIVPVGYDSTRVTKPLLDRKADKVYLIRHVKDREDSAYYDFITKELDGTGIDIHEEYTDIWDLFECIKKFKEIANQEENNHLYINVSTGSKISAIAGMLASMLLKDVEPYYVHIEYPSQKKPVKVKEVMIKNSNELPVFKINKPQKEILGVLDILFKNGEMKKSKLIEKLVDRGIIKQKDAVESSFTVHAKHSQLRAILNRMERDDVVRIKGSGRASRVKITTQGGFALKMFSGSAEPDE